MPGCTEKIINRVALKISPVFLWELFIEVRVLIEGETMLGSLKRLKFQRTSEIVEPSPSTSGTEIDRIR